MIVTRLADAVPFYPEAHRAVQPVWLQGGDDVERRVTVALSHYLPGGEAESSPVAADTVYVVMDGQITVTTDQDEQTLSRFDSVHLPAGTVRSVRNATTVTASMLVIRPAGG